MKENLQTQSTAESAEQTTKMASEMTAERNGKKEEDKTVYATSDEYEPTKSIAEQCKTGPATCIIAGLGVGMLSSATPVVVTVLGIILSSGVYREGGRSGCTAFVRDTCRRVVAVQLPAGQLFKHFRICRGNRGDTVLESTLGIRLCPNAATYDRNIQRNGPAFLCFGNNRGLQVGV